MQSFMSAKEAAEKWNISQRRVSVLCSENRIEGAMMVGNMWIIPASAEKPFDKRTTKEKACAPLKPFVKWVGGKTQLLGELEKTFPQKRLTKYCEPMVGGGALLFDVLSKYNFEEICVNDINAELINAYKVIKSAVSDLIDRLQKLQSLYYSMDENGRKRHFYEIRENFNSVYLSDKTAVEKAAYFIYLNRTCFNGLYRVNAKGKFNVPVGLYKKPTICDVENLLNISKALQRVTILCGDYSAAKSFIDENTFVYLDPPYRPISETSDFTAYNPNIFDDNEQIRLSQFVDEISGTGAKIVLSNSDPKNVNPDDNFFDDLYRAYNIVRVSASRMINSKSDRRGKINELIISN